MNAIVPHTPSFAVTDLERMAVAFAASKLFGVQNPDQALALCLVAQAEGRHPASAAQDYHIINGRPAKKADAMLRDFIASGGRVEWHTLSDDEADATFTHPMGGSVRLTWDHDRAKAAGISNPMWRKYPRQMLRSRIVSEGVRTVCPMATSGMYVPEEVQDFGPVQVVEDDALDGTPQPRKSAHQARKDGDYERLTQGLRACETEEQMQTWAKTEADLLGAIPHGWAKELREEYGERLAAIRAKAADPYGLRVDLPTSDKDASWLDYIEDVLSAIAGAPDEDQVKAAQVVNAEGLATAAGKIAGVPERIAEAAEARMAALSVKAAA